VYGVRTSFEAEYGSGGRVVVFNAEYDALPDIGHACGHNLIATSSFAGFIATVAALKYSGAKGRVRLLGTPAEEGGNGKGILIERGAYNGVDGCVMAHPTNMNDDYGTEFGGIAYRPHVGITSFTITVKGKAAHAAASPWNGVNALDAVVLGYNAVSMTRQMILPHERLHGYIVEGGRKNNIIPDHCRVNYGVRSSSLERIATLRTKVIDCFKAGIIATGCEMEVKDHTSYCPLLPNKGMTKIFSDAMASLDVPMICDFKTRELTSGATDQGNVALVVPAIHPSYDIRAGPGNGNHTAGFTHAANTDFAFDRTLQVGMGMAQTAWAVLSDDAVAAAVKAEFDGDKERRRVTVKAEEELALVTRWDKEAYENGTPSRQPTKCSCSDE